MATIVGGIGTSHVPAIGKAIAKGQQQDPYWKPFFDGYPPARAWLGRQRPNVAVIFYNDHGLNFFLNAMPTFAVGAASVYCNADEGWGLPVTAPFLGEPELSWRIVEGLVEAEFDPTICQEMLVDHAVAIPMALLWPDGGVPVRIVPIAINTVQHPLPSARRCFKLGQAVGRAIEAWDSDARVVVLGTGGLSHQLDGARAGFINRSFDQLCLDKLSAEPEALTGYSALDLVELSGSQGVEILAWLAMRGALGETAHEVHRHYHIPISNTAAGLLVLAKDAEGQARAAA
jgi:protocatechuate 4,5-dioxygenase, beta chain